MKIRCYCCGFVETIMKIIARLYCLRGIFQPKLFYNSVKGCPTANKSIT